LARSARTEKWWKSLTHEEQKRYLEDHPRSTLRINKRKPKPKAEKSTKPADAPSDDKPDDVVKPQAGETPAEETPAEKPEDEVNAPSKPESEAVSPPPTPEQGPLSRIVDGEPQPPMVEEPVKLSEEEQTAIGQQLNEQLADKMRPMAVRGKLDDDDEADIEDNMRKARGSKNSQDSLAYYTKAAARIALKAGLITAGVVLVGGMSPAVLFLPQVYGEILHKSDRISRTTTDFVGAALSVIHKGITSGQTGRNVKKLTKTKAENKAKARAEGEQE